MLVAEGCKTGNENIPKWAQSLLVKLELYERRSLIRLAYTGEVIKVLQEAVKTSFEVLGVHDFDEKEAWKQAVRAKREQRATSYNALVLDKDKLISEMQLHPLPSTQPHLLSKGEYDLLLAMSDTDLNKRLTMMEVVHRMETFVENEECCSISIQEENELVDVQQYVFSLANTKIGPLLQNAANLCDEVPAYAKCNRKPQQVARLPPSQIIIMACTIFLIDLYPDFQHSNESKIFTTGSLNGFIVSKTSRIRVKDCLTAMKLFLKKK
ncbi:unnamed protein product [Phytophthora lilii]|uniref:Unnamed protein product n=1 Tax=Phytophthora lilii TaxID=2077276 RepID=A0A9W6WWP0_9STRA|nr:unnamed protein product [Phytophthora lilii]